MERQKGSKKDFPINEEDAEVYKNFKEDKRRQQLLDMFSSFDHGNEQVDEETTSNN